MQLPPPAAGPPLRAARAAHLRDAKERALKPSRHALQRLPAGLCALLAAACSSSLLPPALPEPSPAQRTIELEQNWSPEDRRWFHHVPQGTTTLPIPYAWFVALEQPSLREAPLLIEPSYLERYGFIASAHGPDGLPVGFARDPDTIVDFGTDAVEESVGFTCAACHTARLRYRGTELIIEGGPALTDLGKFRKTVGLAFAYTRYWPPRFARFARRVLGPQHSEEQLAALRKAVGERLARLREEASAEAAAERGSIEEGFGRLDAICRIGNNVFGKLAARNQRPCTAPVNYPHLWDASWFDWVQYNASIQQPMVRNAGEALGVNALFALGADPADLFRSNVRVDLLWEIEEKLAGAAPGAGLRPPAWPEHVFTEHPIERARAEQGRALYGELCASCHLPAVPAGELAQLPATHWRQFENLPGSYLSVVFTPLEAIGTDPAQATAMRERRVTLEQLAGPLGVQPPGADAEHSFGSALAVLTGKIVERWYDDRQIPPPQRLRMDGYRPNRVQAESVYKARPLNGIWATAPYLHNGSVPDLYALLQPAAERPARFWLGNPEFDPQRVGYVWTKYPGGFELDTRKPGNTNGGHEFADRPGPGVIGRALSEAERAALLEFLKTL
jgi:hypothetical protein